MKSPKLTPFQLFEQIAQDNEILRVFKYHSLRVMYMSCELAKRTGYYDEDFRIGSLLHDIGKIGLSKDILLKTEKLTELEYQIIQAHSHIGNTIIRKSLGNERAARFVRDHHERWDGKGYPRGLSGDEISFQGRIICLCDAFDTMTIDRRTYNQNILTNEEAFYELKQCAWSQFDGNLVKEFIKMMKDLQLPPIESWYQSQTAMKKLFND